MKYDQVANLLGKLLSIFSLAFLLPLATAIYYGERIEPFVIAAAVSLSVGMIMLAASRQKVILEMVRHKEAFAAVSLAWLLVSLIGCLPYLMIGISPVDSFFESMSGFTTTGASVLTPEDLPKSILLWRSMTQWLGGMGIIVLFLAVIPNVAKRSAALFQAEYPGVTLSKVKPRIRDTAIALYKVYLFLTFTEIAVLLSLGVSLFDAVNHTFTTLSTGGYSTHSESIAYFRDPRVEAAIAFFAAIGGTNFALLYFISRRDFRILKDAEFRVYILFLTTASLLITALNMDRFDLIDSIRYSVFQTISIMTTTGYTTHDFDTWSDAAKLILLTLMFIGGCTGSTGGGMKVLRVYLLIRYAILQILKAAEPRTVRTIKYGGKAIKKEYIEDITAFFVLYVFIFIISSIIIALSGHDLLTSISATAATLGNVGPGLGLAGASETYAAFAPHIKLLLCLNMWIGRLEIFTVVSLFIPSFWRERW